MVFVFGLRLLSVVILEEICKVILFPSNPKRKAIARNPVHTHTHTRTHTHTHTLTHSHTQDTHIIMSGFGGLSR